MYLCIQNVLGFICRVMDAMGSNIHVVIDDVTEGEGITGCVIGHLGKFHF